MNHAAGVTPRPASKEAQHSLTVSNVEEDLLTISNGIGGLGDLLEPYAKGHATMTPSAVRGLMVALDGLAERVQFDASELQRTLEPVN